MTEAGRTDSPSLSEQVTRLYDLIGGYHATNLMDIADKLGVWPAVTATPGITSDALAETLSIQPFYTDVLCKTAYSFGLLERDGQGWRMGPHFDQILGNPESSFYLAGAARVHLKVGEDYSEYVEHFRNGTTKPYQAHDAVFMEDVAGALQSLPRIFLHFVLPQLSELSSTFETACILDVGCGGGWALVHFAERFPDARCVGVEVEPYSVELARKLIRDRGLEDRCEVRLGSAELAEAASYDVATSFLVIHEVEPSIKPRFFADVARALKPGGSFLVFDEAYPENDEDLRTMPKRFAALAQWFELVWGNRVNTRSELAQLCRDAGLEVSQETSFSRFHILVATKRP
jgi:SAM-dependent methyltransferase